MTRSTNEENHQTLGAKEMFRQSIGYLMSSYLEQGMTHEQAKQYVTNDIERIYNEYADAGVISKKSGIYNPSRTIDDLLNEARTIKRTKPDDHSMNHRMNSMIRGLQHLKTLIK